MPVRRTLTEMGEAHTEEEILDGTNKMDCSLCGSKQRAVQRAEILAAPEILVLVVNREIAGNQVRARDNRIIEEVSEMRLGVTVDGGTDLLVDYVTKAVIHHEGEQTGGNQDKGHYTAYINKHGTWFRCNDRVVTQIGMSDVGKNSAYVIICRRIATHPDAGVSAVLSGDDIDFRVEPQADTPTTTTTTNATTTKTTTTTTTTTIDNETGHRAS